MNNQSRELPPKEPPEWGPGNNYPPLHIWIRSLRLWLGRTSLRADHVVPAILGVLHGSAKLHNEQMTPQEQKEGGHFRGAFYPPVELLLRRLQAEHGLSDFEMQRWARARWDKVKRQPNESVMEYVLRWRHELQLAIDEAGLSRAWADVASDFIKELHLNEDELM